VRLLPLALPPTSILIMPSICLSLIESGYINWLERCSVSVFEAGFEHYRR